MPRSSGGTTLSRRAAGEGGQASPHRAVVEGGSRCRTPQEREGVVTWVKEGVAVPVASGLGGQSAAARFSKDRCGR
jgi:hypothetical protein